MRHILLVSFLCYCSCSGIQKAKKIEQYITKNNHEVSLGKGRDSIHISYIGCGGFLIQKEGTSIMLDPYFSNLSPLFLIPFKKLKTDTTVIDAFFKRHFNHTKDKKGELKAILVAHSHYDHLADVPSIFNRNCHKDSIEVIGSKTTKHILKAVDIPCKTIEKKDSTILNTPKHDFIYTKNKRVRILPIPSEHAPHIFGMKLISSKKVKKDFLNFPKKARKFPEGENYNFLIDFLDEQGNISFRIFSNAAASCNGGIGLPHEAILKEKKVDILFLCVASFSQVDAYPNIIINEIQPKHIILNHWENFFRPIRQLQKEPAVVPITNVKKFIIELDRLSISEKEFTLAIPLTEMVFYN